MSDDPVRASALCAPKGRSDQFEPDSCCDDTHAARLQLKSQVRHNLL
jgi:hypothetical protein